MPNNPTAPAWLVQEAPHGAFPTTHWTDLATAGRGSSTDSQRARDTFCRSYWQPIYAYLRRGGFQPADAQDLTQSFFVLFLEKNYLHRIEHREGRFRSFLLTFVKRFLSDERDKARALKRGGGQQFLSWDQCSVEEHRLAAMPELTAGEAFDRRWAMSVLERAQERLQAEYAAIGKGRSYEALQPFLEVVQPANGYADAAASLGMPENSVKSAIHRLRRRYGQLIREEIASTVETPLQVDEEIRYLRSIVGDR